MPRRYRVVDVFATRRFAGNPLTVVLDGHGLSSEEMQAIARETNHSETTFVLAAAPENGAWPVRIFTPTVELPFAGHPTLGTAAVLHAAWGAAYPLALDLKAGRIPVSKEQEVVWMRQPRPVFGATASPARIAAALGLAEADVDPARPVQSVSTGVPFWMVPLASLDAVRRAMLDLRALRAAMPEGPHVVLVFAKAEDGEDALHVRCFTEALGIPEDPATGAANGALAAWLARHRYFGGASLDVTVAQGIEMGRPSRLHLRAADADGAVDVQVGGRVIPVAEGLLLD